MSRMSAFKQSFVKNFPSNNRNKVLFIYENFGKCLFRGAWYDSKKTFKMFDTSAAEPSPEIIAGYLKCIEHFTPKEKNEVYNFIFSYSLQYLCKCKTK